VNELKDRQPLEDLLLSALTETLFIKEGHGLAVIGHDPAVGDGGMATNIAADPFGSGPNWGRRERGVK
jgi:hypothetical protein